MLSFKIFVLVILTLMVVSWNFGWIGAIITFFCGCEKTFKAVEKLVLKASSEFLMRQKHGHFY